MIYVFDSRGDNKEMAVLGKVHSSNITFMEVSFNFFLKTLHTRMHACMHTYTHIQDYRFSILLLPFSNYEDLFQYNSVYDVVVSGDQSGMLVLDGACTGLSLPQGGQI